MTRPGISAFIVCHNEERQIRRCLESIKWCDEIIIVDSGSSDRTIEICREYTDRIFQRDWPGYVEQKRFALNQCHCEWILNIDADEVVSPPLADEIKEIVRAGTELNGFYLSRVVYHLGRWWRKGGWYPEYRLRFCRRSQTTWGGLDPHEKAVVAGRTGRLKGELLHYTYRDLADQISRLNRYSGTLSANMYKSGERSSILKLTISPLSRFIKFYFLKKGFLEGLPGFIVAIIEAHYTFLKYSKLHELEQLSVADSAKDSLESFDKLGKDRVLSHQTNGDH